MRSFVYLTLLISATFAVPNPAILPFSIQNRIAGGSSAKPAQFPYQVGLDITKYWSTSGEWDEWCGGSLISDQFVITAGHCLRRAISADVYLGTNDISKDEEPGRVVVKVKEHNFITHENYDHYLLKNDIALIKLPRKITFSDHIQAINLPRKSQRNSGFVNSRAWISGWGLTGQEEDSADILQYAQRMILPDSSCESYFQLYKKETQICVDGSRGISNCPGDSGGPLAVEEDGKKIIVGIVSFGRPKGCGKGFPSVYTRITTFLDWIEEKTGITL